MSVNHEKTWDADAYSKNSSPQFNTAMEFYSQYPFKGNEAILDIGSGDGKITAFLATQAPKGSVIGADRSENMVKFARENHIMSNLTFQQNDAQTLNYHHQFDLIVSNFCLHWVPDKQLAFHNIIHALKPKSFLLAIMAIRNPLSSKIRSEMIQEEKWKPYFQEFFDSSSFVEDTNYEEYALKAGFQIINMDIVNRTQHYENKADLSNFFRVISPHVTHLPSEKLRDLFMQEFIDRYVDTYGAYAFFYTYIKLTAQSPSS